MKPIIPHSSVDAQTPRRSVYVYMMLIGFLALGIFLQFIDFGGRPDRTRGEEVAAVTTTAKEGLARERTRKLRQAAQEARDRIFIEQTRLNERNRDLPPPLQGLSDEELADRQWRMVGDKGEVSPPLRRLSEEELLERRKRMAGVKGEVPPHLQGL